MNMKESVLPPLSTPGRVQGLGIISAGIAAILSKEIVKELRSGKSDVSFASNLGLYRQPSLVKNTSVDDIVLLQLH